ncbi:recombinase RecT [Streptomyces sp. 5-6(2022)]|uniref:recombinase RecT n=1 Tax=Streptomyces sp. 5-6(2022) TaxID=2936510 RepID=UPI0023B9EEC2|nr:recombinase RecT [Streptomyces sp. 5-6(2022)]
MSENAISNAVAVRDNGPEALVRQYKEDFTLVLPSHVKGETWMRLAYGALRRDQNLLQVATRNPGSLMNALLECARLGHEPASDSYYLVPFGNEVQGIEGYRGVVERIYRAGAVKVVKAEVIRQNDVFEYDPDMERPVHKVDWFGERGEVVGAYAYGIFQDGSTSRVVVIDRPYIDKVRKESRGSDKPSSPWVKWFDQMVLKTVARRLEPWVPTSTEWRKEQMRAAQQVAAESHTTQLAATPPPVTDPDEVVEGELMDDDTTA